MPVKDARPDGFRPAQVWIYIGAALFLLALLLSAILVPDLRILHSLQALIYVAVIVLARQNSAWGYGAGFSIAILWNAMGLFITHLIQAGAIAFWLLLRTGHAEQLVPMTVTLGAIGHLVLIVATILASSRLDAENRKWWKFAGGGALSVSYFALLVAFFKPH
ncbi:MAG: hypothetical protein JO108_13085 [Acidobacteriaceae bacterium]|nr:hypothetical protein [Acidobacteriaceae bacterium]